ncbi:carbohydrate-binding family 9-like protein [Colwellia sp. E2M01]|uniref:carbohydrate-binding family 9-like protein n=1 Tax=Colwellia sp. E2M01 TaxID=2841561 RepID=UPI001C085449|nr:carbohydrate-binding family 9-like protein [Colwellia sp. E2M01]MBU2871659.1 carbohydrate-binding family 9-like protein [Colwellia sp. E2M01]
MKKYLVKSIQKTNSDNTIEAGLPDWQNITPLDINIFPWYQNGKKQQTQVKLCVNKDILFIQFIAQDKYSFAKQTQLNNMLICEDSCVEFFFSPSGILGSTYINLEVNCCGTLHIAYGASRDERQFISSELAKQIICKTSLNSTTKVESPADKTWTVELALPFTVIKELTGENINKEQWYANFYRCGGNIEAQYAVWNKVEVKAPDYHKPEYFGQLCFPQKFN